MSETDKKKEFLKKVKAKKDAHEEFKDAYNKQLAFDFNLFDFIDPGENKISEILAFFLSPEETHGQEDAFLKEFVGYFFDEKQIDKEQIKKEKVGVRTEFSIAKANRRIDLLISLDNFIIAIENKIWAEDLDSQLKDYSDYLNNKSGGNYKLFYLNPYKSEPSEKSIDNWNALAQENKFEIISYEYHIINLLNRWIAVCEADNVEYFLKQLKQYLQTKFTGKNLLTMTNSMRKLIYDNQEEVDIIIKTFEDIDKEMNKTLDQAGKQLDQKKNSFEYDPIRIEIETKKDTYYKYKITRGDDSIWIRLGKVGEDKLHLRLTYQILDKNKERLSRFIEEKDELVKGEQINVHETNVNKIVDMFTDQVNIAIKLLKEFNDPQISNK